MWALYGIEQSVNQRFIGEPFITDEIKQLLAVFDHEGDAKAYVENSKLKKPIKKTWCGMNSFKSNSLLSGCAYAEIEAYVAPPVNPKLSL